jgi:hypothetical protein
MATEDAQVKKAGLDPFSGVITPSGTCDATFLQEGTLEYVKGEKGSF